MNSRERILSVFKGDIPDRVPVSLNTLSTGMVRANDSLIYDLLECTDPNVWVLIDSDFTCYESIFGKHVYKNSKIIKEDNKTVIKIYTPKGELTQLTENRDESDWVIEHFFKDINDLEKFYSFKYDPFEDIDISEYLFWNKFMADDGIASIVIYDAPIMLYSMMGPKNYYLSLMDNFQAVRDFTEEAAARIDEYVKRLFKIIGQQQPVFLIAGPEAYTRPMTSNYFYKELVLPYVRKLIKMIQASGRIANIHQHGMVGQSLESLIEMRPSAVSPFEAPPAGDMELKQVKEKLSGKICVTGNLDDLQVLTRKSEKESTIRALELLRDIAPGGGFILGGTDSSVLTDEMIRNFILMGKISRLYGNYPINTNMIDERLKFLKK